MICPGDMVSARHDTLLHCEAFGENFRRETKSDEFFFVFGAYYDRHDYEQILVLFPDLGLKWCWADHFFTILRP